MAERADTNRGLFEVKAREAAERLDRAAAVGRQLDLLATPATPADPAEIEPRGPGRPVGSRNKRTSKLRGMLAARGFRMPEDLLAELAGLSSRETAVELAMKRAEQVLTWAYGATASPKGEQRLAAFLAIFKEQSSAASALLPYGLEKLTPDQAASAPVVLVMPGQAARPGDQARVIDGSASDMAPPPMPKEIERNQAVDDGAAGPDAAPSRTERVSR